MVGTISAELVPLGPLQPASVKCNFGVHDISEHPVGYIVIRLPQLPPRLSNVSPSGHMPVSMLIWRLWTGRYGLQP
jgi:hypothetical protein